MNPCRSNRSLLISLSTTLIRRFLSSVADLLLSWHWQSVCLIHRDEIPESEFCDNDQSLELPVGTVHSPLYPPSLDPPEMYSFPQQEKESPLQREKCASRKSPMRPRRRCLQIKAVRVYSSFSRVGICLSQWENPDGSQEDSSPTKKKCFPLSTVTTIFFSGCWR